MKRLTDVKLISIVWIVATIVYLATAFGGYSNQILVYAYWIITIYTLGVSLLATYAVTKENNMKESNND